MSPITLNPSGLQAGPPSGLEAALQAVNEGWRVHPVGTGASAASDNPATVRVLWAHDPSAAVVFVGMSFDALQRQALAGNRRTMEISEIAHYAGLLPPIERDQILQCLAVQHGFTVAPSSEAAKAHWRREADQVAQFVEERCVSDPAGRVAVSELYRVFRQWAEASGVRQVVGKQSLGDRLVRLGFGRVRSDGSWITGLKIT